MAKITIEYDDASIPNVSQSLSSAPSASITDAEGGAAPGDSSPDGVPGPGIFNRSAEDAVSAGGPPDWLFKAILESPGAPGSPDAAPGLADDATDGGSAPEA